MKLTKEECLDALTELSVYAKYIANKAEISSLFECYERLEQLINEHFDNPPLKFEELKSKMWIWDNEVSEYKFIYTYDEYYECYLLDVTDSVNKEQLYKDEFEENRYFRKEVK